MTKPKFSYIKSSYGRNAGSTSVMRWYRVGPEGMMAYVERRTSRIGNIMYRMGNVTNFTGSMTTSSSLGEWEGMVKEALKQIL